jgi:hypothetical protein
MPNRTWNGSRKSNPTDNKAPTHQMPSEHPFSAKRGEEAFLVMRETRIMFMHYSEIRNTDID